MIFKTYCLSCYFTYFFYCNIYLHLLSLRPLSCVMANSTSVEITMYFYLNKGGRGGYSCTTDSISNLNGLSKSKEKCAQNPSFFSLVIFYYKVYLILKEYFTIKVSKKFCFKKSGGKRLKSKKNVLVEKELKHCVLIWLLRMELLSAVLTIHTIS